MCVCVCVREASRSAASAFLGSCNSARPLIAVLLIKQHFLGHTLSEAVNITISRDQPVNIVGEDAAKLQWTRLLNNPSQRVLARSCMIMHDPSLHVIIKVLRTRIRHYRSVSERCDMYHVIKTLYKEATFLFVFDRVCHWDASRKVMLYETAKNWISAKIDLATYYFGQYLKMNIADLSTIFID